IRIDRNGSRFSLFCQGKRQEEVTLRIRRPSHVVSDCFLFRSGSGGMSNGSRRAMDVSPLWLQAMLLTFVVGFAILGYLALQVHAEHAPVPGRVVDETGRLLMTREEILAGQE